MPDERIVKLGELYHTKKEMCIRDRHRIVLNTKARVSHVSELSVIDEILKAVKQPTTYVKKAGNRD